LLILALAVILTGGCSSLFEWVGHEPEPGLVQLTHYRSTSTDPAWSPDGRQVVFVSKHADPNPESYGGHFREIFTIAVDSGDVKRITYGPQPKSEPAWSPDGRTIAFSNGGRRLCLMRSDGSHLYCLSATNAFRLAWAPDSTRLAYGTGDEIHLLRVDRGKPVAPAEPVCRGSYPVWSPDGRCLAYSPSARSGDVYVMNADGSNATLLLEADEAANPFGWSPDGRFIFVNRGSGYSQLYAISAAGGNEIRLTNNAEYHSSPRLSPDGTRIVFHSLRDEGYNIYMMDVRGVPLADPNAACLKRRLGHTDDHPAWSPDGKKIAFTSARDGAPGIYLFDVDTRTTSRLLPQVTVDPESKLSWAPDGTRLAFAAPHGEAASLSISSLESGDLEIYVAQIDEMGNNPQPIRLTNHPAQDTMPVWSPDGDRLAFQSNRNGGPDIYLLDLATRAVSRLTHDGADNAPYAWSPDGTQIAFTAVYGGPPDIYVMDADGSNVRRLTRGQAVNSAPTWSPDGERLVFVSDRDGDAELYVVDIEGGHAARVTNNTTEDRSPAWSPDGDRLAFVSLYGVCIESAPER